MHFLLCNTAELDVYIRHTNAIFWFIFFLRRKRALNIYMFNRFSEQGVYCFEANGVFCEFKSEVTYLNLIFLNHALCTDDILHNVKSFLAPRI